MTATGESCAAVRSPANQRKHQIASIAAELFCERGYHRVGLGEIAGAAGITGPAVYRHFPNKKALLAYAAKEFADALAKCAEEAADSAGDAEQRLESAVGSLVRMVVQRRRKVRLYQWEHRHLAPEDRIELGRRIRQLVGTLGDLLGDVRTELPRKQRRMLASAMLSGIASLSTHSVSVTNKVAEQALRSIATTVLTSSPPSSVNDVSEPWEPTVSTMSPRREQLLAAAVSLFHERGFHSVSMEEIGTEAGINASSVYRHFASKGDVLAAVYYRAADRLEVTSASAIELAPDAAEALRSLVRAHVRYAFGNRDMLAVYLSEHVNLPADDRHALRRAQRDHVEQWVRLAGEVREDRRTVWTRLLVHAALNIIHDGALIGNGRGHQDEAAYLALAVLGI